jgi:uncharacterized protein (TIGR03437 family)
MRAALLAVSLSSVWGHAQTSSLVWSRGNSSGEIPTPRFDAPIAYDAPGRQLLMFGGQDASGDRNDLWAYSVDRQQWTQINPRGTPPNPRHGHTVTFDPVRRRIIIVAGQAGEFFGDVWAYDIPANQWTPLSGNSSGPSPRYGHSAIYDARRDRIVISHGFTSEQGRFDDTWAFDLATNTWRDISPAGTRPLRRCLHHAVYVSQNDQMLLYGGCSSGFGPCPQGDLWSFDLANNRWAEIARGLRPSPRQRYGMIFDDNRQKLVLFGGLGGPPLNDTWEYDPAASAWTQVTPGGTTPAPRYRIEAAFSSDFGTAFFFGGVTSALSNDLLLLSSNPPPPPRISTDAALPVGAVGEPYSQGFLTTGGVPPYKSYSLLSGTLPPGLSLADSGGVPDSVLVGTATTSGTFSFTLQVTDSPNNTATRQFILVINPSSAPTSSVIANGASNLSGPIAPGEIVVIQGSGLGPAQLTQFHVNSAGLLDTQLAGTQVSFNGVPAPVIYSSNTQVAVVVPYAIFGDTTQMTVSYQGRTSAVLAVPIAAAAPGVFTLDSTGKGPAAALNQDGSINTASSPTKVGDIISLFATGEGQTVPAGVDGKLALSPLPTPRLPVSVTIAGQTVDQLYYVGGAPGEVAGVLQINVQIPSGIQTGNAVPVIVRVGSASSAPGVTISVR